MYLIRQAFSTVLKMGKRDFRKNKGGFKGKKTNNKSNTRSDNWTDLVRENEKWETYYKAMNVIPENEWNTFKKHCQENLPLTFRITGNRAHANEIKENFIKNHVSRLNEMEVDGVKISPKNLSYYPDQLGWQLDVPKSVVRKNPDFLKTQRFLVLETDVGNISRQEAVSMIPPLLMDVQPHHAVLDMCAAPGSKTAQLVEALHQNDDKEAATGFVLANDSDYKRSHMLVHQVKRLNSPNFMVVNHDAQLFPRMKFNNAQEFVKFDRILCDVPCSGDGTMRKNVNVWKDFTVGNALGLHPLQVSILNRGIQLLKRGGRLVYSTCSLSPVENEAVVASALKKWGSQIKLINCENELPGLVRRQGISHWDVFGKDMELRTPEATDVASTVFPPSKEEAESFNLQNCIRVYPHLQNTGGFFIAVFEKIDPEADKVSGKRSNDDQQEDEEDSKKQKTEIPEASKSTEEKKPQQAKKPKMPRDANEEPFVFLDSEHEALKRCFEFYDFSDDFPRDCTLVRNATGEPTRTIYYVSPILREILNSDEQKLKIIHAGVKLFASQRNDNGNCPWRVQNESLGIIKKFLGPKRQVTGNLDLLKLLFEEAFPKIQHVKENKVDAKFSEALAPLDDGCVFMTIERTGNAEDLYLPLWKGKSNLNLMVNKKDTQELLYRVFDIETSAKDEGKEAIYQKKMEANKKTASESAEPEQSEA